jgi:hypothetical protein
MHSNIKENRKMNDELYILWTNSDPITSENMVFMYGQNALKMGWWNAVTIIIWGAPAKLVAENDTIRNRLQEMLQEGVTVSACKACADQLGVTHILEQVGIEVKYWGEELTELLKSHKTLITI